MSESADNNITEAGSQSNPAFGDTEDIINYLSQNVKQNQDNNILNQDNNLKDNNNILDLTDEFSYIRSNDKEVIAQEIENYLNKLINKGGIDTNTPPLQIEITKGNKGHIVRSNVSLNKGQQERHNVSLLNLKKIINESVLNDESDVDLSHNSRSTTEYKKNNIEKYRYFITPIKINDTLYYANLTTEVLKGSKNKNISDLYNIQIKTTPRSSRHISGVENRSATTYGQNPVALQSDNTILTNNNLNVNSENQLSTINSPLSTINFQLSIFNSIGSI